MNKTELVAAMAKETNLSKKDVEAVLKSFIDVVSEELKKGEKVQLVGFGTFEVSERAAREGRNPQTGETMKIEASKLNLNSISCLHLGRSLDRLIIYKHSSCITCLICHSSSLNKAGYFQKFI